VTQDLAELQVAEVVCAGLGDGLEPARVVLVSQPEDVMGGTELGQGDLGEHLVDHRDADQPDSGGLAATPGRGVRMERIFSGRVVAQVGLAAPTACGDGS
jgi:hypothetical protein